MGFLKKIVSWFIPEQKQVKQQTGTDVTKASSDNHIKVIYGTRKTEGTIVFMNTTNPADGDDVKNDLLHIIIVWCEGGIESIDDILLNDISITDSKFNAKDGGRWAHARSYKNGFGTYSDTHLKEAGFDPASKAHRLDGLACTYLRLEWSIDDDAPFNGVPDVTAIIKGRRVKNLETGVTEYSENPAYCTIDYLTNPVFGKGLTGSEYDLDAFKLAGRIADTPVPKFQGSSETQPLFTCNAALDTGQSVLDNTEILSKSMRALMPIINGKITLIIEQDDEPTPFGLSENEFDGALKYDEGSKSKRYNRVIVEYTDKELSFSAQDAVYPDPTTDTELADQWLAEDNGILLEYRFKVSSCTNYYEARQMARILAMISRESLSFTVNVAPIGLRYTVGDVIPITHKKMGWVNKPFRLVNKTDLPDGKFTFNLREHQPYIYNWLSGEVRPPIPDTSLPDPRDVAEPVNFASTLVNDGNVNITWESEYSHFDIQIYKNNALTQTTTTITPAYVISALDAGDYELDVRAASKIGFKSRWVSFGFNVALPTEPVVNIDATTFNTITLSASVTGASLGTTFEWQFLGPTAEPIATPNTASGYNYIYTGLVPDTEYSFNVRTKNLSGVSPWVNVAVKTSLADLLDHISDIPLTKLSDDAQTLIEDINTQVDRLRPNTEGNLPELLNRTVNELNLERQARTDIEQGVFDLSANYTNWRQNYEQRQLGNERLIDAAVYIDPESGTIVNRAFAYTDEAFTEANVLIDGVNARIDLQASRITTSEERLTQTESALTVQAGQINQRATFTEMRSEIAGAIEALTPAYSFHFNNNLEGFTGSVEHNAQGFLVATGVVDSAPIEYDAEENPMLRLRVRKHADQPWLGNLYFGADEFLVNVLEPESESWETTQIDLTGIEGYTGTITALKIDLGHVDIDFIEIGKRGTNDLALNDITTRATILENDIEAATGIMAQYATTTWVNELGYQTQSNVNSIINTFDTTYQVSATLQEFNENDTLTKANNAQQFINGAEAYITSQITAFNAAEDGIDAKLSNVDQTLDALSGSISQNIVQVQGLELDLENANLNDVIFAANQLLKNNELAQQGVKLAIAQTELKANTNEIESIASYTLELGAAFDLAQSAFDELVEVVASDQQALVTVEQNLTAKIEDDTSEALASAQEYTRTAVGYCVDENGDITSESDAVACVADGGSWVAGPLAEYISNLQISDGESTASIKELKQVFKKVNGELVARGGWVLDNNGRAVSVAGYNDGETGNLDLVADVIRQGVMVNDAFVPTSYIDNTDPANPVHTFKGRMVLGDGHTVESLEDIRAQDGVDGKDGKDGKDGNDGNDGRDGINGNNGVDGSRGSVSVQVATASGTWYDSTANAALPSAPVVHDRVTIYKTSDPKVQTTKRFNGSNWENYTLYVHGSAMIEDTLDGNVLRAGTRIESPRIDLIGDNFMKIELASGFGPDDLWYWMGPKIYKNGLPDLDSLTKGNAKEWKDRNANSFTVGTFISGAISNSVSTSEHTDTPTTTLAFTSNGNNINFAVSYTHFRQIEGPKGQGSTPDTVECPTTPTMSPVTGTVYLERKVNSNWLVVKSKTFQGTYSCQSGVFDGEEGGTYSIPYRSTTNSNVSFTEIETPGSGYQEYRVRAELNNFFSTPKTGHFLSLAASE